MEKPSATYRSYQGRADGDLMIEHQEATEREPSETHTGGSDNIHDLDVHRYPPMLTRFPLGTYSVSRVVTTFE